MILENAMSDGFVCFCGSERIAEGTLAEVALAAWRFSQADPNAVTLTFSRETGAVFDLNLSGGAGDVAQRYQSQAAPPAKRGRPKLGVVPREVTLLPRHWEWLARQPGGASGTLRRLVEAAKKDRSVEVKTRDRIAATYKFMSAIAGDLPLFEEASRALFAQRQPQFEQCIAGWPKDIKDELHQFTAEVRSDL